MSKQIIIRGATDVKSALYSVTSRDTYDCANGEITQGSKSTPASLDDCFSTFPSIKEIAKTIGFYDTDLYGPSGYTLWTGNPGGSFGSGLDLLFNTATDEANLVAKLLGMDWLGCLWGTPYASYSSNCPNVGKYYEAYIKLRLNCASFWKTPVETPVKREEFMDSFQYGKKVDVTIAGDFNLKIGQVINLRATGLSKRPNATASYISGLYYITGIKHVVTSSGTHETALALTQIAPENASGTGIGPTGGLYYV